METTAICRIRHISTLNRSSAKRSVFPSTTVETQKDGTTTNKTPVGTTGTVTTGKNGNVTQAEGLVNGTSATALTPKGHAARAQAAAILTRFCPRVVE